MPTPPRLFLHVTSSQGAGLIDWSIDYCPCYCARICDDIAPRLRFLCSCLRQMQVDEVRQRLSETASQIKEKAREYGSEAKEYVQSKTDTSVAA